MGVMSIHIKTYDDSLWEPATSESPDWWKSKENLTKRCPGHIGYFRSGIIIKSQHDFKFDVSNGQVTAWSNAADIIMRRHFYHQIGQNENDSKHALCKFDVDILFRQDKGDNYAGLFLPYDNMNGDWGQICGWQPMTSEYQPVVVNTIHRDGQYHIKKGQPIAKLLFFENPKIDINSVVVDEETWQKDVQSYRNILISLDPHTGDLYNKDKTTKTCPVRKK